MIINPPLRNKIGNAVAARAENRFEDPECHVHKDRCPDCDDNTLELHRLDKGDIVAHCSCGFREQGTWSRRSATQSTPKSP